MKKSTQNQFSIILFFLLFSTSFLNAQNDIILKTSGEEMIGKVIEINTDDLKFNYQNESVQYTIPKSDIIKVTFASGRIEFMDKSQSQSQSQIKSAKANLGDHHNKVAILPFAYIKDQGDGSAAMSQKIQNETYSVFSKKKVSLQFQDTNTTNTLLAKAGVTNNNTFNYSMGEICNILGVEYVVQGSVSVEKTSESSYSNTNTNAKQDPKKNKSGMIGQVLSASSSTSTSTSEIFNSDITMNIYNDKGDNLFNQTHNAFWYGEDAYKTTLNYLAKRTPIYMK